VATPSELEKLVAALEVLVEADAALLERGVWGKAQCSLHNVVDIESATACHLERGAGLKAGKLWHVLPHHIRPGEVPGISTTLNQLEDEIDSCLALCRAGSAYSMAW